MGGCRGSVIGNSIFTHAGCRWVQPVWVSHLAVSSTTSVLRPRLCNNIPPVGMDRLMNLYKRDVVVNTPCRPFPKRSKGPIPPPLQRDAPGGDRRGRRHRRRQEQLPQRSAGGGGGAAPVGHARLHRLRGGGRLGSAGAECPFVASKLHVRRSGVRATAKHASALLCRQPVTCVNTPAFRMALSWLAAPCAHLAHSTSQLLEPAGLLCTWCGLHCRHRVHDRGESSIPCATLGPGGRMHPSQASTLCLERALASRKCALLDIAPRTEHRLALCPPRLSRRRSGRSRSAACGRTCWARTACRRSCATPSATRTPAPCTVPPRWAGQPASTLRLPPLVLKAAHASSRSTAFLSCAARLALLPRATHAANVQHVMEGRGPALPRSCSALSS